MSLADVAIITIETVVHRSRKGGVSYSYAPALCLRGESGGMQRLADWYDLTKAKDFAGWFGQRLNIPFRGFGIIAAACQKFAVPSSGRISPRVEVPKSPAPANLRYPVGGLSTAPRPARNPSQIRSIWTRCMARWLADNVYASRRRPTDQTTDEHSGTLCASQGMLKQPWPVIDRKIVHTRGLPPESRPRQA